MPLQSDLSPCYLQTRPAATLQSTFVSFAINFGRQRDNYFFYFHLTNQALYQIADSMQSQPCHFALSLYFRFLLSYLQYSDFLVFTI